MFMRTFGITEMSVSIDFNTLKVLRSRETGKNHD